MSARRVGRFKVTRQLIDEADAETRVVMAACIVLHTRLDYATDAFEYQALSPQFALVKEGEFIPEYCWMLTRHEPLGQITCRAVVAPPYDPTKPLTF